MTRPAWKRRFAPRKRMSEERRSFPIRSVIRQQPVVDRQAPRHAVGDSDEPGIDAEHERHGDGIDEGDVTVAAAHDRGDPDGKVVGDHVLRKERVSGAVEDPAGTFAAARCRFGLVLRRDRSLRTGH
jgi:hypothetical protein